jgi:hypothetical protein
MLTRFERDHKNTQHKVIIIIIEEEKQGAKFQVEQKGILRCCI